MIKLASHPPPLAGDDEVGVRTMTPTMHRPVPDGRSMDCCALTLLVDAGQLRNRRLFASLYTGPVEGENLSGKKNDDYSMSRPSKPGLLG